MRGTLALIMASTILASPARAAENASDKRSGVVVLQVQAANGIKEELGKLLTDILLVQIRKTKAFKEVLGMADLNDLLALEQQKTLLGCADEECLAQVGGALGVPYFLRSQLGLLGKAYVLTLHLVSVEDAKVASRSLAQAGSEGELLTATGAAVDELLADFKDGAPTLIAQIKQRSQSWKSMAGYAATALGLGLYGMASVRQGTAQRIIERGPLAIDELELRQALDEHAGAQRYSLAAVSAATVGVSLVIWGFMP